MAKEDWAVAALRRSRARRRAEFIIAIGGALLLATYAMRSVVREYGGAPLYAALALMIAGFGLILGGAVLRWVARARRP